MSVTPPERPSSSVFGATLPTPQDTRPGVPSPTANAFAPGTRIHQYELIRELGRGGMGVVFLARDTRLGRRVAIKFLHDHSRAFTERFLVEARATARCNHENIVVIHEVNEHLGAPYMVLEYLEGITLADVIAQRALPAGRVVELMLPVARALARAHADGIIHRDLKPDNILLTDAGSTKVLDFGIAKLHADDAPAEPPRAPQSPSNAKLTRASSIMGTPAYMSPEHWGIDAVDARSDLWAVGVIMYEMIGGRHPLGDSLTIERLADVARDLDTPIASVRAAVAGVPERFARLVDLCLIKRKAERLASARALVEELEALQPGRVGRRLSEGESPYPGLTAFQESDADRFFGRGADVSRALARLREVPLVAVVGPSGTGKSSFVRAGVIPALRNSGDAWETHVIRPGRAPMSALAGLLAPLGDADLAREPGLLASALRARAERTGARVLLFVDQFEELYTLVDDARERSAFTACLAGLVDDAASPLRLVLSMRSDLLDRVAEDARFTEEVTRGLLFLRALDRAGLRDAVTQPLESLGYGFEDAGLVDQMVDALASTPGALPLLQFAASKLWESRDREHKRITQASFDAVGGVAGALASHADEVVAGLSSSDVKLVRAILQRLVTPERTRAMVAVEELAALFVESESEVARVLDHLVQARLLVVQTRGDSQGASVELVHESLIDRWPTLRRWLDEGQEDAAFVAQLREAARQWDQKGRPQGLLWRGESLDEARRWRRRFLGKRELAAREEQYLRAVLELGTRTARLKRRAVVAAFVLLSALVAAAAVALMQIRKGKQAAQEQAVRASQEADRARVAERRVQEQLDQIHAGERAKQAAEQKADEANAEVAMSKEELKAANQQLRGAVTRAEDAQSRAEHAAQKEKLAADENRRLAGDLQKRKVELERLLAAERERADQAERERKRITRELK
jgi:serine/threonine protein kinase